MGNWFSACGPSEWKSDRARERDRQNRRREGQQRRGWLKQTKDVSKGGHGNHHGSHDEGQYTAFYEPSETSFRGALETNRRSVELWRRSIDATPISPSEYSASGIAKSKRKDKQKHVIDSRPPVSQSGRPSSTRHSGHRSDRSRSRSASREPESSGHRRSSHRGNRSLHRR